MKRLTGYSVGILGGDKRESVMMECLLQEGAELKVLGDPGGNLTDQVQVVLKLEDLIKDVDVIVAPMSGTDAQGMIKARFINEPIYLDENFFTLVDKNVPVLIGMANTKVRSRAKEARVKLHLIGKREDVAILNAIPTAEGAIQVAMEELQITIHGCKSLVMGLGKCGLSLAWRLRALGSETYGVTRSKEAIAKAQDLGIHTLTYDEMEDCLLEFDLIYNTVPAMVLPEDRLRLLRRDTLIIDLASAPGGTDFEVAKKFNIRALLSLGLPGKVAPQTSGLILGRIVPEMILKERIGRDDKFGGVS
ncbi:MAG: dipicolinate synthase subunit DpsA [Halanaerobiales bacterium]|nr:dipicolinate synthase subunit DpsA [Halanaerobiales bacterium]